MASMTERTCANCKTKFMARTADVKRGWSKFCTKSCKAIKQEKRTGQNRAYLNRSNDFDYGRDADAESAGHIFDAGYFGHGQE